MTNERTVLRNSRGEYVGEVVRDMHITAAEEKVLTRALFDFMADFVDAETPIHPGALVYDPITGEDITFADMFRIVRLHKR